MAKNGDDVTWNPATIGDNLEVLPPVLCTTGVEELLNKLPDDIKEHMMVSDIQGYLPLDGCPGEYIFCVKQMNLALPALFEHYKIAWKLDYDTEMDWIILYITVEEMEEPVNDGTDTIPNKT